MAYDSARGVTVLFGGADGYSYKGDTWELVSPCDEDGDGIEDDEDSCPGSDLRDGLMIADCDSGVSNHLADDGCTMTDQIGECEAEAAHHGEFVRCVVHLTRDWIHAGTIDQGDARAIRRCAARAEIPPPPPSKSDRPNPARVEAEPSDRTQAGP